MRLPEENIAAAASRVGIGDSAVGGPGDCFRVTLGSCVALALVHGEAQRFAVAHVLLPGERFRGAPGPRSRCADTVVPFLLELLGNPPRRKVAAYVAGGGAMYGAGSEVTAVGPQNAATVLAALAEARLRVVGQDLGGDQPRQLVVSGPTHKVLSLRLTSPPSCERWELPAGFERRSAS